MQTLVKMQSHADSSVMEAVNHFKNSAMEADTISKHGARSKSLMSRANFVFSIILAAVISVFMFPACGNDDGDDNTGETPSNVVYSGGAIFDYGEYTPGLYNYDILLYSSGVNLENGTGTGNLIEFELWSTSPIGLPTGTYTFANSPQNNRFTYGNIYTNFNLRTETGSEVEIVGGSVTITSSGGSTTVSWNVTTENGRTVTGSFTGALPVIDNNGGGDGAPSTPTGLTAVQSGTSVIVSWNAVSGATGYGVYRSGSASGNFTLIGSPSGTSFTDASPLNGNNSYLVVAINNSGTSNQSSVVSVNYVPPGGGGVQSGMYLGIIGFHENISQERSISLLTRNNLAQFRTFVDGLTDATATALYYAVDNAIDRLSIATLPSDLSNVAIVTFTDGIDNASPMLNTFYLGNEKEIFRDDVSKRLSETMVKNLPIRAYSIGIRGTDVGVSAIPEFLANLPALSTGGNWHEASDMAQVEAIFRGIASDLRNISQSQTIELGFPGVVVNTGQIRFTFDKVNTPAEAAASNFYIQGTYTSGAFTLQNITYEGMSSSSGSSLVGVVRGVRVFYNFENVTSDCGNSVSTNDIKLWYSSDNGATWTMTSEFDPDNDSETVVTEKSAAVMLVLDCTRSLGTQGFIQMQNAAKTFINVLAGDSDTGGGSGVDRTKAQVRFQKNSGGRASIMTVDNSLGNELARHNFGAATTGTSNYVEITPGNHILWYSISRLRDEIFWINNLPAPHSYNFQAGRRYTIVSGNNDSFTVTDNGTF